MNFEEKRQLIRKLSDGVMKSREIADKIGHGCTAKYVQGIWRKFPDIPRPRQAPPSGSCNPAWNGGRSIQKDGYVLIPAPPGHPYAKIFGRKSIGRLYEHRKVMEDKIGRLVEPHEVVDHIDGCTIHNDPENLRLFDKNSDHLKATLRGRCPEWTEQGYAKMCMTHDERKSLPKVDIYHYRRKCGALRLLQILRAHALLDKDSPYLLGTAQYLDKANVDVGHFLNSKLAPKEYLQQEFRHLWWPTECQA